MEILPKFTALDITLLWISLVSLSWFVYSFFEIKKLNKKMKHSKSSEEKRWREIEEKAQKDYEKIMEAANKKAEEIIQNSTKVSFDISTSLKQTVDRTVAAHKTNLEATSMALENKYAGELEEINRHNIQLLTNVYEDIEITAKSHFEEYQKVLEAQNFEAEKQAKARIEEDYLKLQKELETVREQKISELNSRVNNLVTAIAKEVIGKSLDSETQSRLITQSLDEAKKEGAI